MADPVTPPRTADSAPKAGGVLRRAHLSEIDPRTVYLLAKLRQDVFTLEQHADDADLDGRELEDPTVLLWIEESDAEPVTGGLERQPVAQLRILRDPDGTVHIGRVLVRADHRRDGYGRRLVREALDVAREIAPEAVVEIGAQAYLERWYASMGFETTGPLFMEAGIEHVPMRYEHPRG